MISDVPFSHGRPQVRAELFERRRQQRARAGCCAGERTIFDLRLQLASPIASQLTIGSAKRAANDPAVVVELGPPDGAAFVQVCHGRLLLVPTRKGKPGRNPDGHKTGHNRRFEPMKKGVTISRNPFT